MAFWGDYHTHTTYSHGKGSVLDNARVAAQKGLGQIAITDHGLSHVIFGVKRKELPRLRADCEAATAETGVRVLVGMETISTRSTARWTLLRTIWTSST